MAAPPESVIVPVILPVLIWQKRKPGRQKAAVTQAMVRNGEKEIR
jgi:hypothetical protein